MSSDGASNNERLIAAARQDNEDLLLEIFEKPSTFNINYQDSLGNTALHYAAKHGSTDVLEHILSYDDCDVDLLNRLDKDTPLHLAVKIGDLELRSYVVESLLEAGADTSIKNKHGDTAMDLLRPDDPLRAVIRKSQAQASVSRSDIVDEDDDEPGSGSGSESE